MTLFYEKNSLPTMRKDLEFLLCFIFVLPAWKMMVGTSGKTCPQLRFTEPRSPADVVTIEEGSDVNVTFYLNLDGCHDNKSNRVVVVSGEDDSFRVPVCKIVFYGNRTCEVSKSSVQCACLNSTLAHFRLRGSLQMTGKYFWSVSDSRKGSLEAEVTITFRVTSVTNATSAVYTTNTTRRSPEDSAVFIRPLIWAVMSGPMFVICVVATFVVVWCIRRRRLNGGRDETDGCGAEQMKAREQRTVAFEQPLYESTLRPGDREQDHFYDDMNMAPGNGLSEGRRDEAELPRTYLRPV